MTTTFIVAPASLTRAEYFAADFAVRQMERANENSLDALLRILTTECGDAGKGAARKVRNVNSGISA
jgi:hypothetical protein